MAADDDDADAVGFRDARLLSSARGLGADDRRLVAAHRRNSEPVDAVGRLFVFVAAA
jgi:hypothetical protein